MAGAALLCMLSVGALAAPTAAAEPPSPTDDEATPGPTPASEDVVRMTDWVIASHDNHGLPFVVIDKTQAEIFVFAADGQLKGAAPALLGLARGDDSAPGIGELELAKITPEQRTTPAGRFVAGFGPSGKGDVLWVDYEAAVSLHPVVNTNPKEHRLERLATPTPDDNRITFGCINVPAAFYQDTVLPAFTGADGVIYILPETRPLDQTFPDFRPQKRHSRIAGLVVSAGMAQEAAHPPKAEDPDAPIAANPDAH